jgi:regulator of replication initiation timing
MDVPTFLFWFAMAISLSCSVVTAALAYWRPVSASTSLRSKVSSLETDMVSLNLELERVRKLLKSLSNRTALADYKEKAREEQLELPPETANMSKDQLRARFLRGTHVQIARRAMSGAEE